MQFLLQFLPSSDISMICMLSMSLGYAWGMYGICVLSFSLSCIFCIFFRNIGIVHVLHELYRVEIFVFILENIFVASCQRNKN